MQASHAASVKENVAGAESARSLDFRPEKASLIALLAVINGSGVAAPFNRFINYVG